MAQLLGFIYALFLIISNFGKNFKQILIMQTLSFIFKSIHYLFLGGLSGFLTSFISIIRNILFIKTKNIIWTIIFILIYLIIGFYSANSFYAFLPIIATITYTIIINYKKTIYLRYGIFITTLSWLIYNIYLNSYAGIIIQTISFISNITAIIKLDKKR